MLERGGVCYRSLTLGLDIQTDILNTQNQAVANAIYESQNSKQIKLPDSVPASAGGLNKTSTSPLYQCLPERRYHLRSWSHPN